MVLEGGAAGPRCPFSAAHLGAACPCLGRVGPGLWAAPPAAWSAAWAAGPMVLPRRRHAKWTRPPAPQDRRPGSPLTLCMGPRDALGLLLGFLLTLECGEELIAEAAAVTGLQWTDPAGHWPLLPAAAPATGRSEPQVPLRAVA